MILKMELSHLLKIYLFGVLFYTTTAKVSWVEAGLGPKSEKRITRSTRSMNSKCGVDYVFDYLSVANGVNRTNLAYLMKQMNIGNDADSKHRSCNKVHWPCVFLSASLVE